MTGVWLDLALLVLVAASLALFYRLRTRSSRLLPPDDEESPARRRKSLVSRLWYYPRLVRQAGFEPSSFVWAYWLGKLTLAFLAPLLLIELLARWGRGVPGGVLVLLSVLGFFAVDLWLLARRRRRKRRILLGLSFFLDLLVSLLRSGLNLEEAFHRAAWEGLDAGHPLSREVRLVDRELAAGKERTVAFQALAERTGVPQFRAVAAALRLGLKLGNSVEETLGTQADLIRLQRREAARRAIALAPLKTVLPVLLCGFPIFAVLVLFPALVELGAVFRELTALFRSL